MTTSERLKNASDQLAKLSERARQAEDRTAAAQNEAKADVERSADQARAKAQEHADELHAAANDAQARVSDSWNQMQQRWSEHVAKVRQTVDAKKRDLDARRAADRADDAEADALFSIDYAYATIEEAEYAVLDAISARMDAEELATA